MRPAVAGDCRQVWAWRNDPDARAASWTEETIPYAEHERWFAERLDDPATRLFIALDAAGAGMGYARFALHGGDAAEISVAIAPAHRGHGAGPRLIAQASQYVLATEDVRQIRADLKRTNVASFRAFMRAGFVVTEDVIVAGVPACRMIYERHVPMGDAPPSAPPLAAVEPWRILFRVDAGARVGLGHLQRCLSLAEAFRQLGATSCFAIPEDVMARQWIARSGAPHEVVTVAAGEATDDIAQTLELARRQQCRVVVTDSYALGEAYLRRLRAAGHYVMAIDDLNAWTFPCHMVVNSGAQAPALTYHSPFATTQFLLGPRYALLRPEFLHVPARVTRPTVAHVVVTLGGADPAQLMPTILRLLDGIPQAFTVSVISGPFDQQRPAVRETARAAHRAVYVVEAPEAVRDLLCGADLAIAGGGQTLYELMRVGCPTIAIEIASNQEAQLQALAAAGVIQVAGRGDDRRLMETLDAQVRRLLSDGRRRERMSAVGQRIVDGRGALRVAHLLRMHLAGTHVN